MNNGLTKTLMAVAVAVMAVRVFAMAPVIGDIPSPVVGNADVTQAVGFVYPEAIDLTQYVTDVDTDVADIVWSYDTVGTSKYRINGADALAGDDPTTPATNKAINTVQGGEVDLDSNAKTITIRNVNLSPTVGVAGTDMSASPAGIIDSETQIVTLFASDGTQTDETNIEFYTTNKEYDRLSPGGERSWPDPNNAAHHGIGSSSADFGWADMGGTPTATYSAGTGLCMTVRAGDNAGNWKMQFGKMVLVANNVYRIRATMTGSQTTVGSTPMWDMTVNNFADIGTPGNPIYKGGNLYGANFFFLDNVGDTVHTIGGANTPMGSGANGKTFDFWWCPTAVSTTRWNDTTDGGHADDPPPFNSGKGDAKDGFIEFRVMCYRSVAVGDAASWTGQLCMKDLVIDRFDLNNMQMLGNVWNQTSVTDAVGASGNTSTNVTSGGFTAAYSSGVLTVTPSGAGTSGMIAQIDPGDRVVDFMNQAPSADDFPCPMDNQTLYQITVGLSAPSSTDAANPPDLIWVGADTFTTELICFSWTSINAYHVGMPNAGNAQEFKSFFYSNYGTIHSGDPSFAWWSRFRPRVMIGNSTGLGGGEANTGSVRLHSWKVDKVAF